MRIFIVLLIAIAGGPLYAETAETNADANIFTRLDADGNGQISGEELMEEVNRIGFSALDLNGDGLVSKEEWLKADKDPESIKHFAYIDTNNDGQIDPIEFGDFVRRDAIAHNALKNLDANADGYLTEDELKRQPSFSIYSIRF